MSTIAPRSALRTTLLVGGSILVIALLAYLVVAVASAANRTDASREVTVDTGFDTVSITAEVADVTLAFGDVDETVVAFEQHGANRDMSFEAESTSGTLTVAVAEHGTVPWFFGDVSESPLLIVTLPVALAGEGLTVELETDAGDVVLDGDFGEVDVVTTVGDLRIDGSAERLGVETTVGDVTIGAITVTGDASIATSAGEVDATLAAVPSRLDIITNVGNVDLTLPAGEYRIDTSTNTGDVTIDAPNTPDSDTIVNVETTVGDITIEV